MVSRENTDKLLEQRPSYLGRNFSDKLAGKASEASEATETRSRRHTRRAKHIVRSFGRSCAGTNRKAPSIAGQMTTLATIADTAERLSVGWMHRHLHRLNQVQGTRCQYMQADARCVRKCLVQQQSTAVQAFLYELHPNTGTISDARNQPGG